MLHGWGFKKLLSSQVMCEAMGPQRLQGLNLGAVGAETDRRGFIPVNEKMQVLGRDGKVVPHVYCIGDANGAPRSSLPSPWWQSS